MSIIGWIVVGLIAGGLARWIVKDDRSGCIYTMIVGVLGAMIGGWLMSIIDSNGVDEFSLRSIGVAAIGAVDGRHATGPGGGDATVIDSLAARAQEARPVS